MTNQTNNDSQITIEKRRTSQELLSDKGPFTSLLREVVVLAQKSGASDIHIEPVESGIEIRLRINGEMEVVRSASHEHRESVIFESKRLFGLAIGVSGKPQDGRVSLPEFNLDLRVSLLPTFYGEKLVMRLLDLGNSLQLSDLGYSTIERFEFEKATQHDDGLVVISGPTGSGKTRTLYSVLRTIDSKKLNIVTVEDPIEYRLKGINQVQVSPKLGFADALRSILRQDPDVILVGEIRDRETANLCFQAAATGHLVLSTVHANGAIEVFERLKNLGIDALDMKSSLRMSFAQRLEQKLCSNCSCSASEETKSRLKDFGMASSEPISAQIRNSTGCSHCRNGIVGRVPILEWAEFEELGDAKLKRSLQEARIERALRGEIDAREVFR